VQAKSDLQTPWSASTNLACLMATNAIATLEDHSVGAVPQRFYQVVKQP
jgi:hypothetical protein